MIGETSELLPYKENSDLLLAQLQIFRTWVIRLNVSPLAEVDKDHRWMGMSYYNKSHIIMLNIYVSLRSLVVGSIDERSLVLALKKADTRYCLITTYRRDCSNNNNDNILVLSDLSKRQFICRRWHVLRLPVQDDFAVDREGRDGSGAAELMKDTQTGMQWEASQFSTTHTRTTRPMDFSPYKRSDRKEAMWDWLFIK